MADAKLIDILKQGSDVWNKWREDHLEIINPDLTGANLREINLSGANLLSANFREADLKGATFSGADLRKADLIGVDFRETDFSVANLKGADFRYANLRKANLRGADLTASKLQYSVLVETTIEGAILTDSTVYGLSAWNIKGKPKEQSNLIITLPDEPKITVDNLQVAQFIYLILNNTEIRHVIDTVTSKVVLILGRFTEKRKNVLDAIKVSLHKLDYLPIIFDFEGPQNQNITETVSTLAHLAKFVIADITDAKSIPQELMVIVPFQPSVPVQPLLLASQKEYGMFEHFKEFRWVMKPYYYTNVDGLLASLQEKVIQPAETYLARRKKRLTSSRSR